MGFRLVIMLLVVSGQLDPGPRPGRPLLGELGPEWRASWRETRLSLRANTIAVVENATGDRALHITSEASASALWRELEREPADGARLSWRWLTDGRFANRNNERTAAGDDFRARIIVAF